MACRITYRALGLVLAAGASLPAASAGAQIDGGISPLPIVSDAGITFLDGGAIGDGGIKLFDGGAIGDGGTLVDGGIILPVVDGGVIGLPDSGIAVGDGGIVVVVADAGATDAGADGAVIGTDAGLADGSATPTTVSHASGCSVSPIARASAAPAWLASLGLLGLVMRRARRRSTSP